MAVHINLEELREKGNLFVSYVDEDGDTIEEFYSVVRIKKPLKHLQKEKEELEYKLKTINKSLEAAKSVKAKLKKGLKDVTR
jgi:hypothetical protein